MAYLNNFVYVVGGVTEGEESKFLKFKYYIFFIVIGTCERL